MSKTKTYIIISVFILCVVSIFTLGVLLGLSKSNNRDLKNKEKEHLKEIALQDSIIRESSSRIVVLKDSMDNIIAKALEDNMKADGVKVIILKDKKAQNEEIASINNLSIDSNLRLFARQSEEYEP